MGKEFVLRDEVVVHAPLDRCFLLSTSVKIVERELRMHPVQGRTAGVVVDSDTIRWEGWQLGLWHFHESLIEDFRRNEFFRDRMIAGRFARFEHDHHFANWRDGAVLLRDEVRFTMRWGWLGELLGAWVLAPRIRGLMGRRFALLKHLAESEEWRNYVG